MTAKTVNIESLVIEVTRKCNMGCEHCLRGSAENKSIDKRTLRKILQPLKDSFISCVTFSGGEPTLNLRAIENALLLFAEYNIEVGNFYIVTNGKMDEATRRRLVRICNRLYDYCCDNSISGLTVSQDMFHNRYRDRSVNETIWYLEEYCYPYFREEDKKTDFLTVSLIDEGRSKKLAGFKKRKPERLSWESMFEFSMASNNVYAQNGNLYLTVEGKAYPDCNMSYYHMRKYKSAMSVEEFLEYAREKAEANME